MPGADWEYEQMDIAREELMKYDKYSHHNSGSAIQAMEESRRDMLAERLRFQEERIRVLESALMTQADLVPPQPINIQIDNIRGNDFIETMIGRRDVERRAEQLLAPFREEVEKNKSEEDEYLDRIGVDNG